jgi:hypothetical protein
VRARAMVEEKPLAGEYKWQSFASSVRLRTHACN